MITNVSDRIFDEYVSVTEVELLSLRWAYKSYDIIVKAASCVSFVNVRV